MNPRHVFATRSFMTVWIVSRSLLRDQNIPVTALMYSIHREYGQHTPFDTTVTGS